MSHLEDIKLIEVIAISKRISERLSGKRELVEEIIGHYRAGLSQMQIAEVLIPEEVEKSAAVARRAIRNVLNDYLSPEEFSRLGAEHVHAAVTRIGYDTLRRKKGIHAQTPEERKKWAEVGYAKGLGKISPERKKEIGHFVGLRAKEEGWGIFGMTPAQRSEESKKAISNVSKEELRGRMHHALRMTGKEPMSMEEKSRILELARQPKFQVQEGSHKGKPDYLKIQQRLKEEFSTERSVPALRSTVCRLKKEARD